ncbi:MAG: N-acyl homoserine lactonase family protein [Erysipelotrichaceae bacterium]
MIRVDIIQTGWVRVDRAIPYGSSNPIAITGLFRNPKHKLTLPVFCYLIQHPKANILVDTGWHASLAYQKPKRFFGLLNDMSTPILQEEDALATKLKTLQLESKDIDYVVFTHLDFDHTSGCEHVQAAKTFLASAAELADAKRYFFRYVKQNWKSITITPFFFTSTGIGPMGNSLDLLGDQSIQLVQTPGHSHGHTSVKITGRDGYVILSGDAMYSQTSLEQTKIPGFHVNKQQAHASLAWLQQSQKDPNCLGLYASHDPSISAQTIWL